MQRLSFLRLPCYYSSGTIISSMSKLFSSNIQSATWKGVGGGSTGVGIAPVPVR